MTSIQDTPSTSHPKTASRATAGPPIPAPLKPRRLPLWWSPSKRSRAEAIVGPNRDHPSAIIAISTGNQQESVSHLSRWLGTQPPRYVSVTCRCACKTCRKRLLTLTWPGGQPAPGDEPLVGFLVIDAKLKDQKRALMLRDQQLRDIRYAVVALVCRRCKEKQAFLLRGAHAHPCDLDEVLDAGVTRGIITP